MLIADALGRLLQRLASRKLSIEGCLENTVVPFLGNPAPRIHESSNSCCPYIVSA